MVKEITFRFLFDFLICIVSGFEIISFFSFNFFIFGHSFALSKIFMSRVSSEFNIGITCQIYVDFVCNIGASRISKLVIILWHI